MHTSLGDFINEKTRAQEVTETAFWNGVMSNCKTWYGAYGHSTDKNKHGRLFRRAPDGADFQLLDPGISQRRSIESENLHLTVLSTFPSWEDWPVYNSSVIGLTGLITNGYNNATYEVIPFDGATMGVCPNEDVWISFGGYSGQPGSKISTVGTLLWHLGLYTDDPKLYDKIASMDTAGVRERRRSEKDDSYEDERYHRFLDNVMSMYEDVPNRKHEVKKETYKVSRMQGYKTVEVEMQRYALPTGPELADIVDAIFDPAHNGFKKYEYGKQFQTFVRKGKQFWTDSKCYLRKVETSATSESVKQLKPGDRVRIKYPGRPAQTQVLTVTGTELFSGELHYTVKERDFAVPATILIRA